MVVVVIDSLSLTDLVDSSLRPQSGRVFYSGPTAFSAPSKLYLLGLNPGGSPVRQASETIERHLAEWQQLPERWSAYCDESWRGAAPGTWGMQPRIRHMFDQIGIDLRDVPASNVVFVRSARGADLRDEMRELLAKCWPVHQAVIEGLGVSTILCLGTEAGRWVRSLLGADEKVGEFVERNERRWKSEAHANRGGICVVTLTHPGVADWRNPVADPTPLILEVHSR
jgi:hypothetical protein